MKVTMKKPSIAPFRGYESDGIHQKDMNVEYTVKRCMVGAYHYK